MIQSFSKNQGTRDDLYLLFSNSVASKSPSPVGGKASVHAELRALCTIYSQPRHVTTHREAGGHGGRSKIHQSAWWSGKGLIIRDSTQEK